MKQLNVKFIAESAIIAALYVALTWLLAPISYGSIQFRISEVLLLLVVFNPKLAFALVLGTFISNTTSSLGWWDMVFGTLATTIAIIPMCFVKKIHIAAIFPVISNAIIVALELKWSLGIEPVWLSMITVGLGEAVVLYLLGIPAMMSIAKNEGLMTKLDFNQEALIAPKNYTFRNGLAITLGVIGIILFIAYPFYEIVETIDGEDSVTYYSALSLFKDYKFMCIFLIAPILYVVAFLFSKKVLKLIALILCSLLLVLPYVLTATNISDVRTYAYFYAYILYILLLLALAIIDFCKSKEE